MPRLTIERISWSAQRTCRLFYSSCTPLNILCGETSSIQMRVENSLGKKLSADSVHTSGSKRAVNAEDTRIAKTIHVSGKHTVSINANAFVRAVDIKSTICVMRVMVVMGRRRRSRRSDNGLSVDSRSSSSADSINAIWSAGAVDVRMATVDWLRSIACVGWNATSPIVHVSGDAGAGATGTVNSVKQIGVKSLEVLVLVLSNIPENIYKISTFSVRNDKSVVNIYLQRGFWLSHVGGHSWVHGE